MNENVKHDFIKYKFLSWNKDYSNKLDEKLKKRFKNTFKFSDNDINKFILLLRKGVYPYEYMDDWEKFNETTLPEKEEFYSNLNMEDITDADYMHAKRVCKDFEIKNLGEYHDLYLKSDTLFLANVSENFRKMCLKIYLLDPKYWDVNNLYGWAMSQKLPVNKFEWIKDTSQFNEDFIKRFNEERDEGYFLEVNVQYPEKLLELHNDLPFLPERIKTEKVKKFFTSLHDKSEYIIHITNLKQALNHVLILKKVQSDKI